MPRCTVTGCIEPVVAKDLCNKHYKRQKKHGHLDLLRAENGTGNINRGYRYLYIDGRRQAEHRVVMERMLGRPLERSEQIHHKNGNRSDNRPENLELLSAGDHRRAHAKYFRNATHKECCACHQIKPRSQFPPQAPQPGRNMDPNINHCHPCWSRYVLAHRRKRV